MIGEEAYWRPCVERWIEFRDLKLNAVEIFLPHFTLYDKLAKRRMKKVKQYFHLILIDELGLPLRIYNCPKRFIMGILNTTTVDLMKI